jgi:hypothetical protein
MALAKSMTTMTRTRPALVLSLLSLSGCAAFAGADELSLYRSIRYEADPARRTHLGSEYVTRYPQGRFISSIGAEVSAAEEQFWEERRSTLDGLQAYIDAYPNGSHVGEARARIGVYEQERLAQRQAREARERAEREAREAARAAENERQRMYTRETMLYWLRATGAITGWGTTLGEIARANQEFANNFQNTSPAPVCRGGRCVKQHQLDFYVPVPGRAAQPRRLQFGFALTFTERRLNGFSFTFANQGLATWYERETQTAVLADNAATRDAANAWALANLKGVVAMAFPNARETPESLRGEDPPDSGDVADDTATPAIGGDVVDDTPPAGGTPPTTPPTTPPAGGAGGTAAPGAALSGVPNHPLNTQFSYIVGHCGGLGGAEITIPEGAAPANFNAAAQQPPTVNGCLRIDGYTAIQGVSPNEGLVISFIPESALPRRGRGRPTRPARPARPARR